MSIPSLKGNRHFSPLIVMHPWGSGVVEIIVLVIVVTDCVVISLVVGLFEMVFDVTSVSVGILVVVTVEDPEAGLLDIDFTVVVVIIVDVESEVVDITSVVVEIVVLVIADVVPLHVSMSHQPYFT